MPAMLAGWKHHPTLWLCAGLFALTLAVFWPVTRSEFISYDDPYYLLNNPMVQRGVSAETVSWAFTTRHASNWHPVTWLSHMVDVKLFGLKAGGHHLTNLLLHGANTVLVLLLLRLLTGAVWRSAVVAGLFALHPLHVESVAWISERKDVLAAFFGLLALMAYTHYAHAAKTRSPQAKVWYGLALVCFALGLMSKPMLVTWPFVMLLLDFWPLRRIAEQSSTPHPTLSPGEAERAIRFSTLKPLVVEKLPFFALTFASCLLTLWAQQKAVAGMSSLPLLARLGNSVVAYAKYLFKTIWPTDLIVHYPLPERLSLLSVLAAVLLLVGVMVWVWWQRQRRPYLLIGWLWFLGTLVPVIGLVQVGGQAMGDRYTYLPLIGIFIMAVWAAHEWVTARTSQAEFARGGAAIALILCAIVTRQQLDHWRNSVTLFEHALAVAPNSFVALDNLGYSYLEQNDPQRAEEVLRRAVAILPDNPGTRSSLGRALLMQGRADEAVQHYEHAHSLAPGKPSTIYDLGLGYAAAGRFDEAISRLEEVLKLNPNDRRPYRDLAMVLDEKGDPTAALAAVGNYLHTFPQDPAALLHHACLLDETGQNDAARAVAQQALALQPTLLNQLYTAGPQLAAAGKLKLAEQCYRSLVLAQPDVPSAHALYGQFLLAQNRTRPALARLREAVRLQPDWPEVLNELAWQLATHPDNGLRNGADAVRLAERACELTEYKEPRFVGTLDAAYAETGRFEDAIKTAEKVRELAATAGKNDVAMAAEERLTLYREKKPYRQTIAGEK